jgi:gluconate 2-dehydrogenase gamma chain
MFLSRRELLRALGVTSVACAAGRVVPLAAAERAHRTVLAEKASSASGVYTPKFFSAPQYDTLRALCQLIIPSEEETGGAIEAGAPEFLDLLTSENKDFQLQLGGGITWLDAACLARYGKAFLQCSGFRQREILDLIAFRKNAAEDAQLNPGIEFFAFLRKGTADGFFTSEIGIKYLGYIGNTYLAEFPGCPAVPESPTPVAHPKTGS